jgi:hypothetical protein
MRKSFLIKLTDDDLLEGAEVVPFEKLDLHCFDVSREAKIRAGLIFYVNEDNTKTRVFKDRYNITSRYGR